ncbi:hypothetical protein SCFA_140039 [anaerobic digester metagenome]|uniref:Uncharacterized protein n=1 Tax=anaerobic digester metagenome TaxID=1263854 RepID=A0A485LVZ5_9ZZZZ
MINNLTFKRITNKKQGIDDFLGRRA